MPKRRAGSTGRQRATYSSYNKPRRQSGSPKTSRPSDPLEDEVRRRKPRATQKPLATSNRSRDTPRPSRPGTIRLSNRPLNRRGKMQPPKPSPARRLPASLVSARKTNEDASSRKTTKCTQKKNVKRAVIIATGYGGINKAKRYKERKPC